MKPAILAICLATSAIAPAAYAQSPFDTPATSKDARAAQTKACVKSDMTGSWLALFEMADGSKTACFFNIIKSGGIRTGFCLFKVTNAQGLFKGKLSMDEDCQVTGQTQVEGVGALAFIAHLSADKSAMTGVMLDPNQAFLPMNVTRWPLQ